MPLPPCMSRAARAMSSALPQLLRLTRETISAAKPVLVHQAPHPQGSLEPERYFRLHVGEFLLEELCRRERPAELVAVESVLAGAEPAVLGRAHHAPGDAVTGAVEAAKRPSPAPTHSGSSASSPTATPSSTISPVTEARSESLPLDLRRRKSFMPFSRTNPRILPSWASDFAHTTKTSAIGELEIQVLAPRRR